MMEWKSSIMRRIRQAQNAKYHVFFLICGVIMVAIMTMGHEHIRTVRGSMGGRRKEGGEKERVLGEKRDGSSCTSTCEDGMTKPTKHGLKERGRGKGGWKYNGGGELVQDMLDLSQ
jgi:hypothetical protein